MTISGTKRTDYGNERAALSEQLTFLTAFRMNQREEDQFTPAFKEEAVRQITERGYSVAEVSGRLGDSALCRRVDGTHWPGKVKMSVHESKSE